MARTALFQGANTGSIPVGAAMSEAKKEISWRAAEYEQSRQDPFHFWLIMGGFFIVFVFALWQRNFLFAIFIALAGLMIIVFRRTKPQILEFKINDDGVRIGDNNFYSYDKFENFSTRSNSNRLDEIVFRKKSTINPYLRVPIDSKLMIEAKNRLGQNLSEVEYQGSIVDLITDWLGF